MLHNSSCKNSLKHYNNNKISYYSVVMLIDFTACKSHFFIALILFQVINDNLLKTIIVSSIYS